jgi:hypothetical protein
MGDTTGNATSDGANAQQFSCGEIETLAAALDEIIPPSADGRLPGAGFLAAGERFASIVRLMPGLDLALAGGLAALDDVARKRGATGFAALSGADRLAVLNEVAASDGGFVPSMMFVAFTTYYVEDRVVAALDLEARPPHPQGFAMGANDPTLLEPVRSRGKLYREC